MSKNVFLKAFTLAEIMIVLTVIGVLTAILLPVAIQSSPDENVMKFKKGNATLGKVISELVNNEKYYADGDLGKRPNGDLIDGYHSGDITYFCQSFSDLISIREQNCLTASSGNYEGFIHLNANGSDSIYDFGGKVDKFFNGDSSAKKALDTICLNSKMKAEITTVDNISYYQSQPECVFGISRADEKFYNKDSVSEDELKRGMANRLFGNKTGYINVGNFDEIYKVFCMDVDEIDKGEDPFGYGIRADGKILTGARADEWINKSLQKGEN